MLRVVERAVLSQCWFHVNSPFICAGGGLAPELMFEQFVIPKTAVSPRHVLEQFFKLIFMSSDSIHDAVLCAERRGRTPARSIDAAIVTELAYGCNCRSANGNHC